MSEDVQMSYARSGTLIAQVADEYRIDHNVVRPYHAGQPINSQLNPRKLPEDFRPRYLYFPLAQPDLPKEFAALTGASDDQILMFVKRYGLLGYSRAFRALERAGAIVYGVHNGEVDGDPVQWVLEHAESVKLVLDLAAALLDSPQLERILAQLKIHQFNEGETIVYPLPVRGYSYPLESHVPYPDDLQARALGIIANTLNKNLEGVSRNLVIESRAQGELGLTSLFNLRTTLECIYWLLADAVVKGSVRRCDYCGCPFVSTSQKMKYCPPRLGTTGVSSCMNNAKQQRFKQRTRHATPRQP